MAKSRDAFRTISEVSEKLDTPAHVLRFWESKFRQIKPVKRAGGRRYYRPDDVALLGGIKTLLHDEGMTIKGAQKLLREKGVKHVIAIAEDGLPEPVEQPALVDVTPAEPAQVVGAVPEPAKVSAPPAAGQVQMPPPVAATPRFFDGFDVAARQSLRANAAQVAPLLTRLEKVSARMRVG